MPTVVNVLQGFASGSGNNTVTFEDVHCSGTEVRLDLCSQTIVNSTSCNPFHNNGVACHSKYMEFTLSVT